MNAAIMGDDLVLVPGAGGIGTAYWRHVTRRLKDAGHHVQVVDLPGSDAHAGLPEYAALIADAVRGCAGPVVVAQSMGGFSAAMACDQVDARGLILVNAMVPEPGETPGDWWEATGAIDARVIAAEKGGYGVEFDLATYFLHDLEPEDAAGVLADPGVEADIAFGQCCGIAIWPDVPTAAVVGRDDRLFPMDFQLRLLKERVGVDATVIPGGHLLALANPDGLADAVMALAAGGAARGSPR